MIIIVYNFESIRSIFELIYFMSGPIIAIIAAIGLWQLKISKTNAKVSAVRESFRLAAERCQCYLTQVIPILDKLDQAIDSNKLTFLENAEVEYSGKSIRVKYSSKSQFLDELTQVIPIFLEAANALEGFAIYFPSGVASEKIAFSSVGRTYCNSVMKLLPALLLISRGKYFKNTLALFSIWQNRIMAKELLSDKQTIEKRLNEIDNKSLSPIGT